MPNPYVIIAALVGFIAVAFGGYEYGLSHQKAIDQVAVDQLKIIAAAELQAETVKTKAAEEAAAVAANEIEQDTRSHEQILADAKTTSDAAIALAGGLRDPGRRGDGCKAAVDHAATAALNNGAAAAYSRLSDQASQFLLSEADRADEVVVRLHACEADDKALREAVSAAQ